MVRRRFRWRLASRTLILGERTLIMGVLNVTPDSFSDGGKFLDARAAIRHAFEMAQAGADILDMGGESTRPGSTGISAEEEIARIMAVLKGLRGRFPIPISIDTRKAAVAEVALSEGAEIVNDISALQFDPALAATVRQHRAGLILMHMRGKPETMHRRPFARDVLRNVSAGLRAAVLRARRAGISKSRLVIDPGIGFGKNYEQNFEILARLSELTEFHLPIVVGTSRKTFLGAVAGGTKAALHPEDRLAGTAATVAAAILGGAHMVRVHDVREMVRAARIADRIVGAS
jgi:dihydropteroate synthase